MGEWQPIETAPKDGTEILAIYDGRRVICRWDSVLHKDNQMWVASIPLSERTVVPMGPEFDVNGDSIPWGKRGPKIWQPLPEPPK